MIGTDVKATCGATMPLILIEGLTFWADSVTQTRETEKLHTVGQASPQQVVQDPHWKIETSTDLTLSTPFVGDVSAFIAFDNKVIDLHDATCTDIRTDPTSVTIEIRTSGCTVDKLEEPYE